MNHLVEVAVVLLIAVMYWETIARPFDGPMVPLGPAELAQRLGLVEAIALKLVLPVAGNGPPGGDRAGALPPPPVVRPCPSQGPQLVFQRDGATEYEQRLAGAHWALGFWCGQSWAGGLRCDDRVRH